MVEYTDAENIDMLLVYGEAAGYRKADRRIYQER